MSERMRKDDRREHLLHIMQTRYERAQSPSDFTAASLAYEAGVSVVWFYTLVGKQFKKLRASLPGGIPSEETIVTKLRKEITILSSQLKDLKAKYEASIKEKFAEAINHIELLDGENRMLREKVAILERRLSEKH